MKSTAAPIEAVEASAYVIPTDQPESDGTLQWDSTTLVVVEVAAAGERGVGYTYADVRVAGFVADFLASRLRGSDALAISAAWETMYAAVRNLGYPGLCALAISAVDTALWDLKGRLLGMPLTLLLGRVRENVPVYGSGGFTSYSDETLAAQLGEWAAAKMRWVKMKVGRSPDKDKRRVAVARQAVGEETGLMVDANSAYDVKQALRFMELFGREYGVSWMEQPLAPSDLAGLRLLRSRAPGGMELADGEYVYHLTDAKAMLEAEAVDVVMPDATRCGGITGFLRIAELCAAWNRPCSSHCAPTLHLPLGCSLPGFRHLEYFYDHVRIESRLFDGFADARKGYMEPDLSRPGLGFDFKRQDAARYAA